MKTRFAYRPRARRRPRVQRRAISRRNDNGRYANRQTALMFPIVLEGVRMTGRIAAVLLVLFPALLPAQQPAVARSTVLNHVTIVSPTGAPLQSDMAIVITSTPHLKMRPTSLK